MSTKGGPVFTFILPGGWLEPLLVAPLLITDSLL